MAIYLGRRLLDVSCSPPEGNGGPGETVAAFENVASLLFGLAPSGVYLAKQVTLLAGELLPHRFTLTQFRRSETGGLLSVALSLASRPVGVTDHCTLWSPDFPPVSQRGVRTSDHPVYLGRSGLPAEPVYDGWNRGQDAVRSATHWQPYPCPALCPVFMHDCV